MTMRRSSVYFAILLGGVVLVASTASALPEPWEHPDGSIHYYDVISTPSGINWNVARDSAQGHGGYLATITSQEENDFVFALVDSAAYWYQRPGSGTLAGPWLGGYQPSGSYEPDSGWRWVTTEPFGFRNWSTGQPDNEGDENALHFGESVGVRVPNWDDLNAGDDSIRGFVRELSADSTTIGLLQDDSAAFPGYTLFAPLSSTSTYLVDNKGRLVHSWQSNYCPGLSVYLLQNGNLLHTANVANPIFSLGGRVEEFDWNGTLVWSYDYSDSLHCQHHDVKMLPNGNVLMIAYEYKTRGEAVAAGRDPGKLGPSFWPDCLIEVNPATDGIVWEWHVWDHLIQDFDSTKMNYGVVGDHSELVDVNVQAPDVPAYASSWTHMNSVDYNAQFDQIMLSVRNFSEVWVIDHSTTTQEARGHTGGRRGMGGDILYRWGNPAAYRAGDSTNQKFFGQHNARWIETGLPGAGHVMVFNNGVQRPGGSYSSVDEFIADCDSAGDYPRPSPGTTFGPAAQSWTYHADPPTSFYAAVMSGAQRLPSGNTLISNGTNGAMTEVTAGADVVWRYINPVVDPGPLYQGETTGVPNVVFRATRYSPDYPGLTGRSLAPGYPIELYQTPRSGISESRGASTRFAGLHASPNPFGRQTTIRLSPSHSASVALGIYSVAGRLIRTLPVNGKEVVWDGADQAGTPVGRGIYCCRLQGPGLSESMKLVKAE